MSKLYEYEIQISSTEEQDEWIQDVIGTSFHFSGNYLEYQANALVKRLKEAKFEIDWIKRRPYSGFEII